MGEIQIIIGTPHRRDFTPEYVLSLVETLRDGRYDYSYLIREGSILHQQRNIICREFLKGPGEYLLFVDSDMAWVPGDIELLVRADKDVVSGLAFAKTFPAQIEVTPLSTETWEEIPKDPFEIISGGTGFMLISRPVLSAFHEQKIFPFDPLPCGDVEAGFPSGLYWEDISFCVKARRLGFGLWCVPQAGVGHLGSQIFMQSEDLGRWFNKVGKAGYEGFSGKGFDKA